MQPATTLTGRPTPLNLQPPPPLPFPPLELFDKTKTVTRALQKDPTRAPKSAACELFPKPGVHQRLYRRFFIKRDLTKGRIWTPEELDQAAERGDFPRRPSDLFLKIFADVLTCLSRDPLAGNVSPALIGTSGVVPLSIVSTIPDIMRHCYDCIVLADKEVFLVTNYWQPSDSVKAIADALRELSKRVGERKGDKVVCKIMWDRGSFKQLYRNHVDVSPATWIGLHLPAPSDVPHLSLQVINFHRPLLGTFHQKALVVDRRIALLNSNNIQDRPNIEMMLHLEGPVVDSIYDVLLLSWHEHFSPVLPCVSSPSLFDDPTAFPYTFSDSNPYLEHIDVVKAAKAARQLLGQQQKEELEVQGQPTDASAAGAPLWWKRDGEEDVRPPGAFASLVTKMVDRAREERLALEKVLLPGAASRRSSMAVPETPTEATELRAVSAAPVAQPEPKVELQSELKVEPEPERKVEPRPESEAEKVSPPTTPDTTFTHNERLAALSRALNAGALSQAIATVDDEHAIDDFKPHVLHRPHELFPIAMVNRKPHGLPGHQDVRVPQDAAWLAGLRYATSHVFIQTPTLNAKPIVRAIIEACSRGGLDGKGIQVTYIGGLGFNDKGESVPFQGGTNEEVVFYLYKQLRKVNKDHNLHVYWYTGKDQRKPVNAVHKTRNCHVKFMCIDGTCAIVGNGNQDTQSWYHSQECNILIDDPQIVADWMDQLRTNQSTFEFGKVDNDGIWRDPKTREPLQAPKHVSCFTAMWAMI